MAGTSLLALIDDIATILDDVAVMSKVAVKKTAGVLGDDLALNAEQVTGVATDRELPVVWAVAKGSAVNKAILVPAALAISAFIPWAITPLLMLGGLFLCFEGCEKLAHKFLHSKEEDDQHHKEMLQAVVNTEVDLIAFEKDKIRGAIRTDFILSAEIVVISLGALTESTFKVQVLTLVAVAVLMTVGVYGLVAGIVKLDDLGIALAKRQGTGGADPMLRTIGKNILRVAPWLMKSLSVVGTAAMFMVGGGIIVHGIPFVHHAIDGVRSAAGSFLGGLLGIALEAGFGIVAGSVVLIALTGINKLRRKA
jgi:hypothetical protein